MSLNWTFDTHHTRTPDRHSLCRLCHVSWQKGQAATGRDTPYTLGFLGCIPHSSCLLFLAHSLGLLNVQLLLFWFSQVFWLSVNAGIFYAIENKCFYLKAGLKFKCFHLGERQNGLLFGSQNYLLNEPICSSVLESEWGQKGKLCSVGIEGLES